MRSWFAVMSLVLSCSAREEPRERDARRSPPVVIGSNPIATESAAGASDSIAMATAGAGGLGDAKEPANSAGGAEGGSPHVGPSTPEGGGSGVGSGCDVDRLGQAVVEHACLHAERGPFLDGVAAVLESDATALDAPHTAYRIVGSGSRNWARFTAPQSGSFAFLGAYPATLVFTRADGSEAQATRHDTACAGLPAAFVLELDEAEAVNLSWEAGELLIVIEALAPFGEQAWESSCACSALSQPCTRDAECCSGYCDEGTCRLIDASPCGGKAVIGDECQTSVTCCSGLCLDERCVAPVCRSSGPCVSDAECCLFCHDQDHCH